MVLLTSETLYGRLAIFKPAAGKSDMNVEILTVLIAMLAGAIRVSTPFLLWPSANASPRNRGG